MSAKKIIMSWALMTLVLSIVFIGCGKKTSAPPKSSVDLIEQDYQDKKLDYETSLLYKAYAIYQHPDLPKKYRSKEKTRDGTSIFREIRRNWDKLSPQTKGKLKPFFTNPLDEESIYQQISRLSDNSWDLIPKAYAADLITPYTTANGKIKIWTRKGMGEEQLAQWVLEAFDIDNIYERETVLMESHPLPDNKLFGDDDLLDIYFVNMTDAGVCIPGPITGNKCPCFIELNKNLSEKELQSAVAHEFFHALQASIDFFEHNWWDESTASWSEHFIYPDYDVEHGFLPSYFDNYKMRESLTKEDGRHEYGSYVWPLYLDLKHGASIIGKIWKACEPRNVDAIAALKATIPQGIEKAFKEFSLWVYNENPAQIFRDNNRELPAQPSITENSITMEGKIAPLIDLPSLSLTMDRFLISPEDKQRIRSVKFDFTMLQSHFPYLTTWAIIKIYNREPLYEDWSETTFRSFCFDLPEENLEEITFIYANTHPEDPMTAVNNLMYYPKEYGCMAKVNFNWNIRGAADINWIHKYTGSSETAQMTGRVRNMERGQVDVTFQEAIVDPDLYDDDPESGMQLVPYGGFSYSLIGGTSGTWSPYSEIVLKGGTVISCSASDSWDGENESKKGYANLFLEITEPPKDISEEELALIPPELRQKLDQAKAILEKAKRDFKAKEPKEGELKYSIHLYFDWLPAMDSAKTDPEASKIKPDPIELEGIFKADQTVIPLDKTLHTDVGTVQLTGTMILRARR